MTLKMFKKKVDFFSKKDEISEVKVEISRI